MTHFLTPAPLTAEAFSTYGDVIEVSGEPDKIINQGMCGRHHDLAKVDFGSGRAGISLFDAKARTFPYTVDMVERHPDGSQAFVPLDRVSMLVIVAEDKDGAPINLKAFVTQPGQSINLHRGTWHGVLAPIEQPGRYIVVDRIGDGTNLEEHWFDTPWIIESV
ncbi:ureidoglycolate lyase [Roseibium alexandrii]|uniref:Ureidoglycolate hydrolase n=1 Tax=Roseibium alexandrii (strain DSM 17067 / NCIMB 14079 / DFL-11) TaxID=244592 RepID=A0A5E8GWZ2_ROSAD|nr:ureidoglycolate lyase [Roseibium alexandrii]EEE44252.1 Ureidoglycolate hydrolase [Roseibium alexandrii DFL-11]